MYKRQSSSSAEPTPYDFGPSSEPKGTDVDSNPFADFGSSIEISDDELARLRRQRHTPVLRRDRQPHRIP